MIKSLHEVYVVARDLFQGRYPAFVYGRGLADDEIPCFCFHGVEPEPFEQMLAYLRDNDYHTLSIDDFAEVLTGTRPRPHPRSVLLTFDDGTASMWGVAYPLLCKYEMRGTVFLVPGRIRHRTARRPNLADVWAGRASLEAVCGYDHGDEPFATWEEIAEMHASGCMDFESHSLDHSLVFVSPRIVDFVRPALLKQFHLFEFPRIRTGPEAVEDIDRLGMPLYETRPRLAGIPRYRDDPEVRRRCVAHVQDHGGEAFFERPTWRRELKAVVHACRERGLQDGYESLEECREAIRFDLEQSRRLIDEHLPGKHTRHLCYPWGVGSALAVELAREMGYRTGFWDGPDAGRTARIGQDPHQIPRIGPDFFYTLPGVGSQRLQQVILKKIRGRLRQPTPYLTH
ncbi:hypothetical protein AWN76_015665 [Rhodothermaceae bacterium RA]|nr:hypothetical protein AWN76_015665 [Rhodothermaceae bacterium RA]